MNTDRLRADLMLLAERAAPPSADLAGEVLDRRRRRARSRWAGAGVAAAVGAAIVVPPTLLSVADQGSAAAVPVTGAAEGLYAEPTRGSLAGDADVVAAALAASWDDGLAGSTDLTPSEADRRVAFVGIVPGGQVWSLVVGLGDQGLVGAWFVDVDPADGVQLQLAAAPSRLAAGAAALLDVAGDQAPLVVVGADGVQFAAQVPGSTSFLDLATDDGVAATSVPGPVAPATLPRYAVVEDDVVTGRWTPTWFDSRLPLGPQAGAEPGVVFPADPVHGARIAVCLQEAEWPVTMLADGSLGYVGQLAADADPAFQADLARCQVESGYR